MDTQTWDQPIPDLLLISSVVWVPSYGTRFGGHLRDMQPSESKSDSAIYYLLVDLRK